MLAPNWAGHDIETNTIVNYFTDKQHTELILRKIEKKLKLAAFTAKTARTSKSYSATKKCSKGMVFGHLAKTLNTRISMTQTGAKETLHLELYQLEILNLEYKYYYFFKGKNRAFLVIPIKKLFTKFN